jgi:LPXTG-motif cell wall-anchored protein
MTAVLASLFLVLGVLALGTAADAKTGCPKTKQNSNGNQYPPGQCKAKLSQSSTTPGGHITISGSGFTPGEQVQVQWDDGTVQTVAAGADGTVAAVLTIPTDATPGRHFAALYGVLSTQYLSAPVAVNASNSGRVPNTGASGIVPMVGAGAGLVLAGGLTLMVVRRRRRPRRETAAA